jgi:hypothetical protein
VRALKPTGLTNIMYQYNGERVESSVLKSSRARCAELRSASARAKNMKNGESNEQENLGNDGSSATAYDHYDFCAYQADATVHGSGFFRRKHKH